MGLAYDFVIGSVITLIAIAIHMMAIELFAPGTALWTFATDGTSVMNGQARAGLWFQMLTVWVPLLSVGGIWSWVTVRIYRRQVATGTQPVRPP